MKIFLDSTDIIQIKKFNDLGIVDGITTNPTLIMKSERNYLDVIEEISNEVKGPVSVEVVANDAENMVKEGLKLSEIAENIVVKVPFGQPGIAASKQLIALGKRINMTLCFSVLQAIIAAKIEVDFISPFVGRLDDISCEGMNLINQIHTVYQNYNFKTQIIVASVRHISHVIDSAIIGACIVTLPPTILNQMFEHPLTNKGIEIFNNDWLATQQKII